MTQVQSIEALTSEVKHLVNMFSDHAKKLEEVHVKVSEIQYDINGTNNTEGFGERLKNIEKWKEETHVKLQKDDVEDSTQKSILDSAWFKAGIAISAIANIVTIIMMVIKK